MIKVLKLSKAREFNNLTKIHDFDPKANIPYNKWPKEWKNVYYKAYPRLDQIMLSKPSRQKFNLYETLRSRESCREFSSFPIGLSQLSDLLYYSGGMKNFLEGSSVDKRMHPSAGGRYPLEIYPFIFNVDKIREGVYHYHIKTHSLELLLQRPILQQTAKQFQQPWVKKSGVLLVVSSVFNRTEMKYRDRGYRHILTECGHLAQNIYLVSTALGLGVCSIGGFIDDGLNDILDIDGRLESVIGVIAVGNKQEQRA